MPIHCPLPQRENLFAARFAATSHAIQIQRQQMRLDLLHHFRESIQMGMPVVLIVDQTNIKSAFAVQSFKNGELILRFPEPASVIVEPDGATDFRSRLRDGSDALGLGLDSR